MMLARNNSAADTVDIGFYGQYHLSGAGVYGGLFRDANDSGKWKLFANISQTNIPDTTINTSDAGYTAATLVVGTLEDSKGDVRTIPKIIKTSVFMSTLLNKAITSALYILIQPSEAGLPIKPSSAGPCI